MIRSLLFLCLMLSGFALAKDPNQAVKQGSIELSSGAGYARYTGSYDANGTYGSYPDSVSPAAYGVPFRVRLGLGKGFEVKSEWSYVRTNKDLGNLSGMSQPSVGLRYVGKTLGVFTNVTLPFATGDLDNGDLQTFVEVGGLARLKGEHFRVTGLASYIDNFDQTEILRAWARPEILWRKGFSTFLTGEFLKSRDKNAYLFTLGPGARVDFSEALAVEATTPFSAAGRRSQVAGWSASVRGLWTLKY